MACGIALCAIAAPTIAAPENHDFSPGGIFVLLTDISPQPLAHHRREQAWRISSPNTRCVLGGSEKRKAIRLAEADQDPMARLGQ
jgi:hypothetical protein